MHHLLFDDSIAREIAPFNVADQEDFKEAYIAGFYSDKLTTPRDLRRHSREDRHRYCLQQHR